MSKVWSFFFNTGKKNPWKHNRSNIKSTLLEKIRENVENKQIRIKSTKINGIAYCFFVYKYGANIWLAGVTSRWSWGNARAEETEDETTKIGQKCEFWCRFRVWKIRDNGENKPLSKGISEIEIWFRFEFAGSACVRTTDYRTRNKYFWIWWAQRWRMEWVDHWIFALKTNHYVQTYRKIAIKPTLQHVSILFKVL